MPLAGRSVWQKTGLGVYRSGGNHGIARISVSVHAGDPFHDICRIQRRRNRALSNDRQRDIRLSCRSDAALYGIGPVGSRVLHAGSLARGLWLVGVHGVENGERHHRDSNDRVWSDLWGATPRNDVGTVTSRTVVANRRHVDLGRR